MLASCTGSQGQGPQAALAFAGGPGLRAVGVAKEGAPSSGPSLAPGWPGHALSCPRALPAPAASRHIRPWWHLASCVPTASRSLLVGVLVPVALLVPVAVTLAGVVIYRKARRPVRRR